MPAAGVGVGRTGARSRAGAVLSLSLSLVSLLGVGLLGVGLPGLGVTAAAATVVAPKVAPPTPSPLPGFPRFRGVLLAHGSSAGIVARRRAIDTALRNAAAAPTAPGAAASGPHPNCETGENPGMDVCWHQGPVVREHTVHLIFWQGPAPPPAGVEAFPAGYRQTIETYFADVATASGRESNVYAVGAQYGDASGEAGRYQVAFNTAASADAYFDTENELPPAGGAGAGLCTDFAAAAGTCITDAQLHQEVERAIAAKKWTPSLHDIFLVFTPPHVGSCFAPGDESSTSCAFSTVGSGYCAYHSSFVNGGGPVLYANLPDTGEVESCDSLQHPNGAGGVDATLDTASHEHEETITDPLGTGWYDAIGQEVADKCLPPETFDIYGEPFGGSLAGGTAYNELLDEHHYWLQTEWSNAAGERQGGCVQRLVNASFAAPSGVQASVPASFDGATAGSPDDPVDYWIWDFGDAIQLGTPEASVSHTYALPGTYSVTLTAVDAHGNSNTFSRQVLVGEAPVPPPPPTPSPPPPSQTTTVTVTTPVLPPTALTASQLARRLGLPRAGAPLRGLGAIALGHAECPPACAVTLRLYASPATTDRGHRSTKLVPIGSLHAKLAADGAAALALRLSASGRALLLRAHRLKALLVANIEDREGASWRLSRPLTLTAPARAARRPPQ